MIDKAQQQAILHVQGPALVIAGPGAGKTHVLIRRIAYLTQSIKIPPDRLLVITFTRAAAGEMKKRYLESVAPEFSGVHFGTFHSIFFSILREKQHLSPKSILDSQTASYILKTACQRAKVDYTRIPDCFSSLAGEIGFIKNTGADLGAYEPKHVSAEQFQEIFRCYETMKLDLEKVDFDDMQTRLLTLFQERPETLDYYRRRLEYFLVDEAQDMNRLQYELIRALASPDDNLFLVGDDDQAIYSFRGASPEIFLSFPKDYPQAKVISMVKNFRCDRDIVGAGLSLIENNRTRFEKRLRAVSTESGAIRFLTYRNEEEEARAIASQIAAEKERHPERSVAALYRTHDRSRVLLSELEKRGLAGEGKKARRLWFDAALVKSVEDYLGASLGTPRREVILRIMNRPQRFIPRKGLEDEEVDFEQWAAFQTDENAKKAILGLKEDLKRIGGMSSFAAISYLFFQVGYEAFARLKGEYEKEAHDKLMALAREERDKRRLFERIAQLRRKAAEEEQGKADPTRGVGCYTFHGAKGLEFDHVYIIDANEGITPSKRAKGPGAMEEERRMFYVAMTRAKHRLSITAIMRQGNEELYPSRFVKELSEYYSSSSSSEDSESNNSSKTSET